MAEIRALIVDDEPLARRGIRQLLAPYREVLVVGECRNGREAVRALAETRPDLVFLDVAMPGLDGFGAIRVHGVERMPLTVFVTAHDEFAVRAFEAEALDYLVKPLSEARFRATMSRVLERLSARARTPIAVPTGGGELLLDPEEIDWIAARDDYAEIHTGKQTYRVRTTLEALVSRLDAERFVRVHRSAIVRLNQVRELRTSRGGTEAVVRLRDGTVVPVSRRRLSQVRSKIRPTRR
ncbi:MAG TPA: LytTR family DNA-binding domain-containing protein [Gemmatimonadales bacterium]|nr:LytTR family DNA-binding domain-containing protein [Gemmatimonadales bacterium]